MSFILAALIGFAVGGGAWLSIPRLTAAVRRWRTAEPAVLPLAGSAVRANRPGWLERMVAARRADRIRAQLVEGLTATATSVRAGLSLPQALQAAAGRAPDPLGLELRAIVEDAARGATLEAALESFEARARLPEVRLLVATLKLARATGGNLAPLLDQLAETLRERERVRGQVRALTAQGRLSAWVVGATPVALLAVMTLVDPSFPRPLVTTPVGWGLLAAAATLEGLGALALRAVVRVDP